MKYKALYRETRPEVFSEILGQDSIVKILKHQVATGTVSHAYLFTGTRGTGKTTTARILAKAVNCEVPDVEGRPCGECDTCKAIADGTFVDVIEIDAASNNGVDNIRELRESVNYPPAVGRTKVYIIDEVHMLSTGAFNALLKTLEEPPENVIFILATTNPEKLPQTVLSRCMRLDFKRVPQSILAQHMKDICESRGVSIADDALRLLASNADGSVRDSLSILEQCAAAGDKELSRASVLEYTGAAGEDFFLALTGAVIDGEAGKALVYIDEIIKRGKDARQILKDWLGHYRNLMVVKYVTKPGRIIGASTENLSRLKAQADKLDLAGIEQAIRLISEYINIGRYSDRPRILLETAAVRLAGGRDTGKPDLGLRPVVTRQISTVREAAPASEVSTSTAKPYEPDEEPVTIIAPAPREKAGSPEAMWNTIVDTIARTDRSFVSLIGRASRGAEFEAGELTVTVRPGKIRLAEDKLGEIMRIAKGLYGNDIFISLRAGDPDEGKSTTRISEAAELETDKIIDEDTNVSDIAADVESLFGIKPEITG